LWEEERKEYNSDDAPSIIELSLQGSVREEGEEEELGDEEDEREEEDEKEEERGFLPKLKDA
jgi:hypothetical protein